MSTRAIARAIGPPRRRARSERRAPGSAAGGGVGAADTRAHDRAPGRPSGAAAGLPEVDDREVQRQLLAVLAVAFERDDRNGRVVFS